MSKAVAVSPASPFDYSIVGLTDEVAIQARAAVARIRKREHGIQSAIFEIGQDLLWAKEALGHGNFMPWLTGELDMSPSTARRYMDVAENLDPKFVTVTNLAPAVLYSLASPSTPPTLRSELVEKALSAGKSAEGEIKEKLAFARRQIAIEKIEAGKSPEAKRRERDRKARQQREWQQEIERRDHQEAERKSAAEAVVSYLRDHLGDDFAEFARLFGLTTGDAFAQALRNIERLNQAVN